MQRTSFDPNMSGIPEAGTDMENSFVETDDDASTRNLSVRRHMARSASPTPSSLHRFALGIPVDGLAGTSLDDSDDDGYYPSDPSMSDTDTDSVRSVDSTSTLKFNVTHLPPTTVLAAEEPSAARFSNHRATRENESGAIEVDRNSLSSLSMYSLHTNPESDTEPTSESLFSPKPTKGHARMESTDSWIKPDRSESEGYALDVKGQKGVGKIKSTASGFFNNLTAKRRSSRNLPISESLPHELPSLPDNELDQSPVIHDLYPSISTVSRAETFSIVPIESDRRVVIKTEVVHTSTMQRRVGDLWMDVASTD